MFPELIRFGPVVVYSYGTMIALGVLAAIYISHRQAAREGVDPDITLEFTLLIVVAGLVGSRLLFVALNWQEYVGRPLAIIGIGYRELEGLSIHGGLAGGGLAGYAYVRRHRLRFWTLADLYARPLAIGMGVGRIGCFLAGCCYGQLTQRGWGTTTVYAFGLRHPSQLYETALLLLLFAFLTWYMGRPRARGQLFAAFVGGSGVARFLSEIFRESERILLGLSLAQWVSIALLGLGFLLWRMLSDGPLVDQRAAGGNPS